MTVNKWIKALGAIFDVKETLEGVTKSWIFLENLFIGSEEVKKELPTESESFIGIDRTVKEIFKKAVSIRNILKFST